MNLTGTEIIRLTRQGQVEIGGAPPLTWLAMFPCSTPPISLG